MIRTNTTRNPDVSVVILTRNSELTLERCLRSVIAQKPAEILAVDSQSTDLTLEILEDHEVETLHDIPNSIGYKRQVGVETARGRYVMFVDSDVELGNCCIAQLRYDLIANHWAGAHAMLLSLRNISYWQRSEDTAFSLLFNRTGPRKQIGMAAAMFSRHVLLECPFDPDFPQSSEDVDLCRRLVVSGFKLGMSSAVAYHDHRQEFVAFAKQRFNYGLGDARLWLKYRDRDTIVKPLMTATSYTLRMRRVGLVPYWLSSGVIEFLGILAGLGKKQNVRGHVEMQPRAFA